MDWILLGGAAIAVWAAASVLGNERQRRVEQATPLSTPEPDLTSDATDI